MKFYGQFYPPLDQVLYERFFKDIQKGFFVECGAWEGEQDSTCKFFEESLGWRGINVEAHPTFYSKLLVSRPDSINVNAALTEQALSGSTGVFNIAYKGANEHLGLGTLQKDLTPKHPAYHYKFKEVLVQYTSFKDLMRDKGISAVDLFVLDVEGAELRVIDGMSGGPYPRIMCVETNIVGRDETTRALSAYGYEFVGDYMVNSFYVRKNG